MPPKKRLQKPTTSSSNTNGEPSIPSDVAQQFEIELCWCIQQLQTGLRLGKLSPKQVQDHTKALNALMSNSAPMVKKRQVMRLAFGDYREKMASEDKRNAVVNNKVQVTKAVPSTKSVFVKKANFSTGDNFKFNFPTSNADEKSSNNGEINNSNRCDNDNKIKDNFHFVPSNNTFKFNFSD